MKLKFPLTSIVILVILLCNNHKVASQCFQIKSILVDACGGLEGLNEMVRIETGSAPLNLADFTVSWPNNGWQGLVQNAMTTSVIQEFNADIAEAGGCGQIIAPVGGIIPPNSTFILFTSYNVNIEANSFGALNHDIYAIFQNNGTVSTGHFANFGSGVRSLTVTSGACSQTVYYDRSFLTGGDGATVEYDNTGQPTYINNGCSAPISFWVEAGEPQTACPGDTIQLEGSFVGGETVLWSATGGTFSSANSLQTSFTIDPGFVGTSIIITLSMTDICDNTINDTVEISITGSLTPDFATTATYCSGSAIPALATTSPNGITGTWLPATVDATTSGTYVFTPDAGQCASSVTLSVTITDSIVPDFATTATYCIGSAIPALATTSPNGITGTWLPAMIDATISGTYVFTPDAGQCASSVTLSVTITDNIVPDFATTATYCSGSAIPALATTSPNGITGTWLPATVDATTSSTYVFTPDAGQCASSVTLSVTITDSIVPDFATTATYCSGSAIPALATTSPNGITGTWLPAMIDATISGTYVFTPDAGQCASSVTLSVTITDSIVPDFATTATYCSGSAIPALATTSPNGITGTWLPATVDATTSGTYVFTPDAGQCASSVTLSVTITDSIVPDFATTATYCIGSAIPALATTSPNGITGTWLPATVDATTSGTYVFTPDAGQCASSVTLSVTITDSIVPDFATTATYCSGSAIPALATTSPNGITGTWLPATVDATTSSTYVFTPDAGQCASSVTLSVTITDSIVPNFATTATYCIGSAIPALATTSPNGITGTWLPATVDATTSGTYVFTPDAGQCASSVTLSVTITDSIVPDFATTATYCSGSAIPALATTSPNGITGTWLPATIDATISGTYVFTPDAGQCASSVTLVVTITTLQTPNVDFTYPSDLCNNSENIFPDLANDFYDGGQFSSNSGLIINIETGEVNIGESPTGLHTITYYVLPNAAQCIAGANSSFDIIIHETETIAITGENSVCIGSTIALQANQNGNWTSSNPDIASVNNQGVVTGLASGQVEVIFTNHSANCPITISKTIQVNALPEVSLQDGTICLDTESGAVVTPYTLTTGLAAQGYTFVWKHNGELLLQTTSNLTVTTAGNYEVTVTNNLTGCSATAQATVSFSTPISGYAVVGEDFHNMQTITVYITGGSGYFSYQLDGGLMQTTSQFTGHFQGDYTITVRDSLGCNNLVLEVTVLNYPRFFTPNDDGFNDFWNISGVNNDAQLYIFDRYGKLLKQLQPNTLTGWDGTYNGEQLPSTDYWFKLIYRNDLGAEKEFKAHFSLKR